MITPATMTGRARRIQVILRFPRSASRTTVRTTRLMIHTLAGTTNSHQVHCWQAAPIARAGCGGCTTRGADGSGLDQAGEPAVILLPVERCASASEAPVSCSAALDVGRLGSARILPVARGREVGCG